MMESELFGYADGTFTGARREEKKGQLEKADHGTVFLDEIGDMPLLMQMKILRVLRERKICPAGGERSVPVDIRVIAATKLDLGQMVADGTFLQELYEWLHVVEIHLPPLRERGNDVLELADHFLRELNQRFRSQKSFSNPVIRNLPDYGWPGNVRELKNALLSAFTLSEEQVLRPDDFPAGIFPRKDAEETAEKEERTLSDHKQPDDHENSDGSNGRTLHEMMEEYEKKVLTEILERCDYNYTKAAKEAGINRSLLYKKMAKYRMHRD